MRSTTIKLFWLVAICASRAQSPLAAEPWSLVGCPPQGEARWRAFEHAVRTAKPGSTVYVPKPYPATPRQVIADYLYQYKSLQRDRRDPKTLPANEGQKYTWLTCRVVHALVAYYPGRLLLRLAGRTLPASGRVWRTGGDLPRLPVARLTRTSRGTTAPVQGRRRPASASSLFLAAPAVGAPGSADSPASRSRSTDRTPRADVAAELLGRAVQGDEHLGQGLDVRESAPRLDGREHPLRDAG